MNLGLPGIKGGRNCPVVQFPGRLYSRYSERIKRKGPLVIYSYKDRGPAIILS